MSRDARERRKGDAPTDATRSENDRRCRRMSRSTRRRRFLTFIGEHAQLHAGRDGGKGKERFFRRFTRYQFRHLVRENTCKSCPCSTSHGSRRRWGASRQLRRGSCKNTCSFHLFKWSSKSQHQRLETPFCVKVLSLCHWLPRHRVRVKQQLDMTYLPSFFLS